MGAPRDDRGRGRLRGALATLALASASVLLALAAAELAARWLLPERDPRSRTRAEPVPPEYADLPVLETFAELAAPGARGLHKGKLFRRSRAGFRGPEYERRPGPGVFRIIVGGDSVTMGSGVEEDEAYPALLESLLDAEGGPRRYEVLNLGLSGLNLKVTSRRLERIGLAYHPDLLVYGFTVNDIEGPAYREVLAPGDQRRMFQNYRRFAKSPSHLMRAVWPRLVALRDLLLPTRGSYAWELRENYFENPEAWSDFTAGLDRLARISEEADLCVHVLVHTQLLQLNWLHPWSSIYRAVSDAARERGLTVTETFAAHRGRDPRELRLSFADAHPNAAGHELLARELLAGLRGLPATCWEKSD